MDEMSLPPQIMAILRMLGLNSNSDAFMQEWNRPKQPYLQIPPLPRPPEQAGPPGGSGAPFQHPPEHQAILDQIREIGGLGGDEMPGLSNTQASGMQTQIRPESPMKRGMREQVQDIRGTGPEGSEVPIQELLKRYLQSKR